MAIIAAIIKLDTPGPAIFSQERVGLRGKKFTVHKFRSMRQDAEKQTGPTWATENDERVTVSALSFASAASMSSLSSTTC